MIGPIWPWLLTNHHNTHVPNNLKYTIFVPFVRNFKGFVNDKLAICLVNSLPLFTEVVRYCLVQCQKNSYHDLRLRLYTFRSIYLHKYLLMYSFLDTRPITKYISTRLLFFFTSTIMNIVYWILTFINGPQISLIESTKVKVVYIMRKNVPILFFFM